MEYSERKCIKSLRYAAEQLGRPPTQSEYNSLDLDPSARTISSKCGSWWIALEKAGLEKPSQRQYSEEDCIRAIQNVADLLGHEPSISDYEEVDVGPSQSTIWEICGSWTEAKEMAGVVGMEEPDDVEKEAEETLDMLEEADYVRPGEEDMGGFRP
jgi:hypothetical protein